MLKNRIDKSTLRRKTVLLLLYPPLLLLIFIFRVLPIRWVRRFANFCGKIFYNKAHKSREWALENLKYVYGDSKSEIERETIAKESFVEILKGFFDYLAYSKTVDKQKYFKLIEVEGEEYLKKAYTKGRGVICLVPHMSSWEFAAITPPMLGYKTSAASKEMKLELLERLIVKFRERRGLKNVTRVGSYQKLVDILKNGECLVLMTDQDTMVKGLFVDFLGKTSYTPIGASRLIEDTDATLVPMGLTRKEDGNYKFIIYPEISREKTDNTQRDIEQNTINQNRVLSEMIYKYPEQWVWMHRRWKTTPEILKQHLENRRKEKERQNNFVETKK